MEIIAAIPLAYSSMAWTTFWVWFMMGLTQIVTSLVMFGLLALAIYLFFTKVVK